MAQCPHYNQAVTSIARIVNDFFGLTTCLGDWNMRSSFSLLFCVSVLAALGCQNEVPKLPPSPQSGAPATVLTRLQQADALDGEEDKVVHRCYVCALGMDGKAEHSVTYEGYTAHLCSAACKKEFERDPESVVATTEIPKKSKD
jgi:YHS domain-containing protein